MEISVPVTRLFLENKMIFIMMVWLGQQKSRPHSLISPLESITYLYCPPFTNDSKKLTKIQRNRSTKKIARGGFEKRHDGSPRDGTLEEDDQA